ncbi:MAG: hypothetical protein VKL39_12865 [Leptolyngbyaceae bacterium]|nr:hypothetical protein [Leptolyngbyaceae bacterium]
MNQRFLITVGAIALLSITACSSASTDSSTTADANSEAVPEEPSTTEPPSSTDESVVTPDLPEGVSISNDGQMVVMEEFSTLDVYCIDGSGQLAISYVGEGAFDNQVVACGETFEAFDAAREAGFADVNLVAPVVDGSSLQLQDTEYTQVQCLSDHAGLEPAGSEESEGHMVLNCL